MDRMVCYSRDHSRPLAFSGSLSLVVVLTLTLDHHLFLGLHSSLSALLASGGIIVHGLSFSFRHKFRSCTFGYWEGMNEPFIAFR